MTYCSVAEPVCRETVVKRSRFVALVAPVEGQTAAEAWLDGVRSAYPDATHVCFAYIADPSGGIARSSDAGEPKGTAGLPILDVLSKRGLRCTAAAVVRYFGGIKLGAGGLVRAYSQAVCAALDTVRIATYAPFDVCEVRVGYDEAQRVRADGEIGRVYGDDVTVTFAVPQGCIERLRAELCDRLGRAAPLTVLGTRYRPSDSEESPSVRAAKESI